MNQAQQDNDKPLQFFKPLGPDTAGYMEPGTYIDAEMMGLLWQNEINSLARQFPQFLMGWCGLTAFQVLNLFIFFTVQLSQQILMSQDDKARDLLNFYTQRAFDYFKQLEREGVPAKHKEDPNAASFFFYVPPPLDEQDLTKLRAMVRPTPPYEN